MLLCRPLAIRHLYVAHQWHQYATIANDHWPSSSSWSSSSDGSRSGGIKSSGKHPTPYQILALNPTDTYTKHRFIELVKLYHPDHKHSQRSPASPVHSLPEHVRLERYRLIVAAHALLSDPVKRAAYDVHGIGWLDGLEDSVLQRSAGSSSTTSQAARAARANATWQDWERWRHAYEHEHPGHNGTGPAAAGDQAADGHSSSWTGSSSSEQHRKTHDFRGNQQYYYQAGWRNSSREPVYMRNSRFISLLIVLSIGAGAAQTVHAENLTAAKRLVREERHWQATQDYRKSQELARRMGREQRIEEFVRQRDPAVLSNPGLKDLVMNPDLCESGTDDGRYKELDMKRMFSKK